MHALSRCGKRQVRCDSDLRLSNHEGLLQSAHRGFFRDLPSEGSLESIGIVLCGPPALGKASLQKIGQVSQNPASQNTTQSGRRINDPLGPKQISPSPPSGPPPSTLSLFAHLHLSASHYWSARFNTCLSVLALPVLRPQIVQAIWPWEIVITWRYYY
jgi:hypothetical protein